MTKWMDEWMNSRLWWTVQWIPSPLPVPSGTHSSSPTAPRPSLLYYIYFSALNIHGFLDWQITQNVCPSAIFCPLIFPITFASLLIFFSTFLSFFSPYLSINASIYLGIDVSDDYHEAQCLAQADKVCGCVMECSAQQPGSDANKLIFWQIKKD